MAILFVTEYVGQPVDRNGAFLPMAESPDVNTQVITIAGASARVAAPFNVNTKFVRLHTDVICSFKFGDVTVDAAITDSRMGANTTEYFGVGIQTHVAVILNT